MWHVPLAFHALFAVEGAQFNDYYTDDVDDDDSSDEINDASPQLHMAAQTIYATDETLCDERHHTQTKFAAD